MPAARSLSTLPAPQPFAAARRQETSMINPTTPPTPDHILATGLAFWQSKVLLSAVELGLFTALADGPLTAEQLRRRLDLHPRAMPDFADALLALGLLQREGCGPDAAYSNTPATQCFLDRREPGYVGGWLEMANKRLYPYWGRLTEALRTGQPQNELRDGGPSMFETLYREPKRLEPFMSAMSGWSAGNFSLLAERFDFSRFATLADIGGASGQLACTVARRHPQLRCTTLDLPAVSTIAEGHIARAGLAGRVRAQPIDFLTQPFPAADVITMGLILHEVNVATKRLLIRKAFEALPAGGCLIVVDHLIDDDRRSHSFGLLMSLNMLIEFGDAFDYSGADFDGWARDAGFSRTEVMVLAGPGAAAVAWKEDRP
jgi:hypothetical protein